MYNGSPLVENHVETHIFCLFELATHGHIVAVVDHKSGQHGEVEQPLFTNHPVVTITSTDANMANIDADIRNIQISG